MNIQNVYTRPAINFNPCSSLQRIDILIYIFWYSLLLFTTYRFAIGYILINVNFHQPKMGSYIGSKLWPTSCRQSQFYLIETSFVIFCQPADFYANHPAIYSALPFSVLHVSLFGSGWAYNNSRAGPAISHLYTHLVYCSRRVVVSYYPRVI